MIGNPKERARLMTTQQLVDRVRITRGADLVALAESRRRGLRVVYSTGITA